MAAPTASDMIRATASERDQLVRIERPVADDDFDGAGSGSWQPVGLEWVGIVDALPSRSERLAEGINVTARPARIRMRYRDGVTTAMRLVLLRWDGTVWIAADRIMQIVSGPAVLGRREGLEFMVQDYTSAGNAA
jgi:head-tail adaptor